jgi:hypothetical protein
MPNRRWQEFRGQLIILMLLLLLLLNCVGSVGQRKVGGCICIF